jgi:carboxylate-amine ligase
MTNSMIEISTGVCHSSEVLGQLTQIRDALVKCADKLNIAVVGGGTHPFQQWHERRIYDKPRFQELSSCTATCPSSSPSSASMCTSAAPTPTRPC